MSGHTFFSAASAVSALTFVFLSGTQRNARNASVNSVVSWFSLKLSPCLSLRGLP